MIGAILGDVIGSVYEAHNTERVDFVPFFDEQSRPTDDSVLTVAIANCYLTGHAVADELRAWFHRYPFAGYGDQFIRWAGSDSAGPNPSWGNGAAMRVAPIAWAEESLELVQEQARRTARVTHTAPEAQDGAAALASALYLARTGVSKDEVVAYITRVFGYDVTTPMSVRRVGYSFDASCQGTVPHAIRAAVEGRTWEHAVRLAIWLGGDSDTLACMAGAVAEGWHSIPPEYIAEGIRRCPEPMRHVIRRFYTTYTSPRNHVQD